MGAAREAIADELTQAYRVLVSAGQTDMVWGHVSARDPEGRGVWMKAATWGFEEVTPERLVLVSPEGEVLEGEGRRHLEFPIHTKLMEARLDVGAVVHSHAPATSAFASLEVPLKAISHDAVPFLTPENMDIPRYAYTGNLVRDDEAGAHLAETVGEAAGALMPAHGFVVVGESLAVAVMRAILLDRACSQQLQALAAGGPRRWSGDAEVAAKQDLVWSTTQYETGYDYLLRRTQAPVRTDTNYG